MTIGLMAIGRFEGLPLFPLHVPKVVSGRVRQSSSRPS